MRLPMTAITRVLLGLSLITMMVGCAVSGEPAATPTGPAAPVTLVVPRFNGGSVPVDAADDQFWTHRGYPASQLRLGVTYDRLINSLSAGPGRVIGASYDWRMPAAPPQGISDGVIDGLLSHWNDPGSATTFEYTVDYLRYWLIQAVAESPSAATVNVVAHSTGASVVRAYMQSDAYGATVLDPAGRPVKLPTIGKLVMAAPPQQGAPFLWNLWNGDFSSFRDAARGADIFQGYSRAYKFVIAGGTITGPAGNITRSDLKGRGLTRQVSFLRLYNPLLRLVLPTTAFLFPAGRRTDPVTINDSADRNETLLDLNATTTPGSNPWARLAQTTIATYPMHVLAQPTTADSKPVQTNVLDQTQQGTGGQILPFTAFDNAKPKPIATKPGQTWYSEIYRPDAGDGAFTTVTMQELFFTKTGQPDPGIQIQQWGNGASPTQSGKDSWVSATGDLSHNLFIENPVIIDWIAEQMAA